MASTQNQLLAMFLWSLAVGGILALLYDVLHLSRLLLWGKDDTVWMPAPNRRLSRMAARMLLTVEDVFFGVICGIAFILLLYYTNDGRPRAWALAGACSGYGAYALLLRAPIRRLFALVTQGVRWMLRRTGHLLLLPFGWLVRLWRKTVVANIQKKRQEREARHMEELTRRYVEQYIALAEQGFGMSESEQSDVAFDAEISRKGGPSEYGGKIWETSSCRKSRNR